MTKEKQNIRVLIDKFMVSEESLLRYCKELFLLGNEQGLQGIKYSDLIIYNPNPGDPLSCATISAVREGTEEEVRTAQANLEKELKQTIEWVREALDEVAAK